MNFLEQMTENVRSSLIYPFHIDQEKLIPVADGSLPVFNPDAPDSYHEHDFESLLRQAYLQPRAFYLTQDDAEYYSAQEIDLINKVVEREKALLDKGYKIVNIDLTPETEELLDQYCAEHNMTLEEAVTDILTKMVETYKDKT